MSPADSRPFLEVVEGDAPGRRFVLEEGETTIGRGETATIRLHDQGQVLSRVHARLQRVGRRVQIAAVSETNPTQVGHQRIGVKPCDLADGDVIVLAERFRLRFCAPREPAPAVAAVAAAQPGGGRLSPVQRRRRQRRLLLMAWGGLWLVVIVVAALARQPAAGGAAGAATTAELLAIVAGGGGVQTSPELRAAAGELRAHRARRDVEASLVEAELAQRQGRHERAGALWRAVLWRVRDCPALAAFVRARLEALAEERG